MLPSKTQFREWTLPSQWTFVAALMGIFASLATLISLTRPVQIQETPGSLGPPSALLLQTAQELRYNHEWLSTLAIAHERRSPVLPVGHLKSGAIIELLREAHPKIVEQAYGEEKSIYQLILKFEDLGSRLGTPKSNREITQLNHHSDFTLHDIHFLNNFLLWYLLPLINEEVDLQELYSLGGGSLFAEKFEVPNLRKLQIKYFRQGKQAITHYADYLALID